MKTRRGLALILVVGVLGVLAVLGSVFAVLSRLERRSARQRVLGVQALLLARSGLEDAQARALAGQAVDYGGEDWDNSGTLNGLEGAAETFHPGVLDRDACPARLALRPSWFARDTSSLGADLLPAPRRVTVDGRTRGYSGQLAQGTYSLKALPDGGFPVNAGDPAQAPDLTSTTDFNTALRRMLGTLAEALDREDGVDDGLPVDETDGFALIDARPVGGWLSLEQVRGTALGVSQAKLDALKDYLVLSAWTDLKVVQATAGPEHDDTEYSCQLDVRRGRYCTGPFAWSPAARPTPGLQRIGARTVGRPPVDLSWARRHRPALLALLGGLRGVYCREFCNDTDNSLTEALWYLKPVEMTLDWSAPSDDARAVADRILASTSELSTWGQWNAFCDSLPLTGASDLGQAKKDLLKAAFNPNTDVDKFNPELSLRKFVDKTDIYVYSTELNLVPHGAWKVSVSSRVLDASGRTLASRAFAARLAPEPMLKLTAQREFVAGNLGRLDVVGDETGYRALGSSPYITGSSGTSKTFGHKISGPLMTSGVSLQAYPESHTVTAPALYDGQVKLATVETADQDYTGNGGVMKFLARWDDGYDADVHGGVATVDLDSMNAVVTASNWKKAGAGKPWNSMYPDGAYQTGNVIEPGTILGYPAPGNMSPANGTMSWWIKYDYDTSRHVPESGANFSIARLLFNDMRWLDSDPANLTGAFYIKSQTLRAAFDPFAVDIKTERGLGIIRENAYQPGDNGMMAGSHDTRDEQVRCTEQRDLRPCWTLATFFWDMVTPRTPGGADKSLRILMDRGRSLVSSEHNTSWSYAGQFNDSVAQSGYLDSTLQEGAPAVFYLGPRGHECCGPFGADATYDEFAIYDFGLATGAVNDGIDLTGQMALQRYVAGRFYKESAYPASGGLFASLGTSGPASQWRTAGEWFSAPVDLGQARLGSLAWTQIQPLELPQGRIAFELAHAAVQVPAPLAGPAYALDARGKPIDGLFKGAAGERLSRRVLTPFRFHAVFQPNLADKDNTPILDPLALDDVTLSYRPDGQAAFSAWESGD